MIHRRCAIYTRKSTEEGLDQDFNSLDAQREACAAYVLSQRHEGWSERGERYDDGGFSGGSMARPGLARLLGDIEAGRVDVVVVYKVDRLTRSLTDFARIIEIFDAAKVSFVSVTQSFNTTSSMGRLTLNVLLSFAQFEREVTAERIRDKVAASKKKGMWMGGAVPFGFDVRDKALIVNPGEAGAVRAIFEDYLTLGSVRALGEALVEKGIHSRRRTDRFGRVTGGGPFSRGALYALLRNPIYKGDVAHRGEVYPGRHAAIVDKEVWAAVQDQLAGNGGKPMKTQRKPTSRMLSGKLFDGDGAALKPSYSLKRTGPAATRRYWYYAAPPLRLPADEIEKTVCAEIARKLVDRTWLADRLESVAVSAAQLDRALDTARQFGEKLRDSDLMRREEALRRVAERIIVADGTLILAVYLASLLDCKEDLATPSARFEIPFTLAQNGRSRPVVIHAGEPPSRRDPELIALIADARRWMAALRSGEAGSVLDITAREGQPKGAVSRILPLAFLAPDISKAILEGRQPPRLTAKTLRSLPELPLDWSAQRRLLGFPPPA